MSIPHAIAFRGLAHESDWTSGKASGRVSRVGLGDLIAPPSVTMTRDLALDAGIDRARHKRWMIRR
jgi:hypothetical protein